MEMLLWKLVVLAVAIVIGFLFIRMAAERGEVGVNSSLLAIAEASVLAVIGLTFVLTPVYDYVVVSYGGWGRIAVLVMCIVQFAIAFFLFEKSFFKMLEQRTKQPSAG